MAYRFRFAAFRRVRSPDTFNLGADVRTWTITATKTRLNMSFVSKFIAQKLLSAFNTNHVKILSDILVLHK